MSMSLSLIAVFMPILLMGGIVGRLFREFAVTLSMAILISLVISLTTTPMMCALLLRPHGERSRRPAVPRQRARVRPDAATATSARWRWALRHARADDADAAGDRRAERLSVTSSSRRASSRSRIPGRMIGGIQADQSISFQAMQQQADAVAWRSCSTTRRCDSVVGFTGGRRRRPDDQYRLGLRRAEAAVASAPRHRSGHRPAAPQAGARCPAPGCSCSRCRISASAAGRATPHYQYTLQADNTADLYDWAPKLVDRAEDTTRC